MTSLELRRAAIAAALAATRGAVSALRRRDTQWKPGDAAAAALADALDRAATLPPPMMFWKASWPNRQWPR